MPRPARAVPSLLVALPLVALLAACSAPRAIDRPLLDLRNPNLSTAARLEAVDVAEREVDAGTLDPRLARAAYKDLAWAASAPEALRLRLLEAILADGSADAEADSRTLVALMLPNEQSRRVTGLLAVTAASRGWTEATPGLIRSFAKPAVGVPDEERVERAALLLLHEGRTIEEILYEAFLDPRTDELPGADQLGLAERVRRDAWTLLSRFDPGGERRRELIENAGGGGAMVEDLRAGLRRFGVVPDTAAELEWLAAVLRRETNAPWRAEVESAIASVAPPRQQGLALRHLEPVRWAARHRPGWLGLDRDELAAMLLDRAADRPLNRRTAEVDGRRARPSERIEEWAPRLPWGDALAVLVVDEALHDPLTQQRIFSFVELDYRDESTEYGGVIESLDLATDASADRDRRDGALFRPVLFPPRTRDRGDDGRFIASDDLFAYSDRALAHFHQQVQERRHGKFAGPSGGDLAYAANTGRACVVITSLDEGRLAVDAYLPGGEIIDLGEIRAAGR